jgi:hypothetical protein
MLSQTSAVLKSSEWHNLLHSHLSCAYHIRKPLFGLEYIKVRYQANYNDKH